MESDRIGKLFQDDSNSRAKHFFAVLHTKTKAPATHGVEAFSVFLKFNYSASRNPKVYLSVVAQALLYERLHLAFS